MEKTWKLLLSVMLFYYVATISGDDDFVVFEVEGGDICTTV